ncbi:Ty1/Copia family ribonuclease HI, partial [Klebsiella pneumoniae]|uniref:Ty1/Copia family ribonuclease HI n=1 Tax=Klebsiella pneumoniae TaxID=573 RepID=UPI003A8038E3
EPETDKHTYQRIVGRLIYLTATRPDISYAVNIVSRFMQNPRVPHMNAVTRILRYIKGTLGQGLWLKKHQSLDIVGFADADWAGDIVDRKSTSGYCIFVGGNLTGWKSKKQRVISKSSAEAEYRAMADCVSELTWTKMLLGELGCNINIPSNMFCDNTAAIYIASNPVFHERTKHIEIDCHFIREKIVAGEIKTPHTQSCDEVVDALTKGVSKPKLNNFKFKWECLDIHSPLEGEC